MTQKLSDKKNLKPVLVKLLQGFLTKDHKKLWVQLVIHQEYVRSYFQVMGLYLHFSLEDGYAFLKTTPEENVKLPGDNDESDNAEESDLDQEDKPQFAGISLIKKFPLTFEVSLLLVLLREALEQFDEKVNDDFRLIYKRSDIYELLKTFYYNSLSGGDETKLNKKFDSIIVKVSDMGFLKELKNNSFEVQRSIKAFINASFLQELKETMFKTINSEK